MLWLVIGGEFLWSSTSSVTPREPKEFTPPAPATELRNRMPRRSASMSFARSQRVSDLHLSCRWTTGKKINGKKAPAKRQPPEHLLRRASGIAAIVIALLKNLAILELQKRCEVGAHLGSRWLALKRRGQRSEERRVGKEWRSRGETCQ